MTDSTVDERNAAGKIMVAALIKAQKEMGAVLKDAKNPAFKSTYATLQSVLDACKPALNNNGFAIVQTTVQQDGNHLVETTLYHDGGGMLTCMTPLIIAKNDMQGYGSAVTYARRYGLLAMTGLAPEDDDGDAAAKAAPPKRDFAREVQDAIRGINRENDTEGLLAFYTDLFRSTRDVATDKAVVDAKEARKAALAATPYGEQG